ncbi:hypothetical protein JMUB6875_26310 [Nocardia sp. JMUB6875]|uniref:DUF7373 family lipoprotein n=1 Tax=Nocardia sp. JMUB6875 TaxID=3158170 RepID=UPI0032E6617A
MRRFDPARSHGSGIRRGYAEWLPVFSIAVLVTACTIAGAPRPVTAAVGRVDLGGYSGRPLAAPRDAGETYGGLMESVRMADAVVSPRSFDPALSQISAIPVPTPLDAVGILADATRETLADHGMLAGFSIGGTDDPSGVPRIGVSRSVRLTVLRMRDNMTAIDAARQIDARDFAVNRDNVPVPFVDYFATHGHWRTYEPTLAATLAHGPFVVTVYVTNPTTDRAALQSLAETAFDAELPVLDAFTPTPAEQLATLPLDPEGMLGRLLPATPGQWPYPELFEDEQGVIAGWRGHRRATGIAYGPLVADIWLNRPGDTVRIPVQAMAVADNARLLRFPDAVAARHALLRLSAPTGNQKVATAPGRIPDAACLRDPDAQTPDQQFTCLVLEGRYLALVSGATEESVHRMAVAQYAMLTDSAGH